MRYRVQFEAKIGNYIFWYTAYGGWFWFQKRAIKKAYECFYRYELYAANILRWRVFDVKKNETILTLTYPVRDARIVARRKDR